MRTTCSRSKTKILPSPIFPVFAAFSMASIARSTRSLLSAASILTFGRKSTTYSAPRYSSVCPFCLPNPLTSVTVIPCTPMAERASRTSSSLNGLMMAVTSFMALPSTLERFLYVDDSPILRCVASGQVGVETALRVAPGVVRADFEVLEESVRHRVRHAGLPIGVAHLAGGGEVPVAPVVPNIEIADVREDCPGRIADRYRCGAVDVPGAVGLGLLRVGSRPEIIGEAVGELHAEPLPA